MSFKLPKKIDKGWIGFLLGFFFPIASLYAFQLIWYSKLSFIDFYNRILLANGVATASISLCVISNLLVFFIFIWTDRNSSARGVVFSTIFYAAYIVYKKFIQ